MPRLVQVPRLELAEGGFPARGEDLGDRPLRALDLRVHVHEGPPEPARDLRADRRLAGSHEADEDEVLLQRVGCHGMRSR